MLRDHATRTNTGAMRLLRGVTDRPRGLSVNTIQNWLYGTVATATPEHYRYVLARWEALPTELWRPLTPDMIAALNTELLRTGHGPVTMLRHWTEVPKGLTWQIVRHWSEGTVGKVNAARWDAVMHRLTTLPDFEAKLGSRRAASAKHAPITNADLAALREHRSRTGVGGAVLLRAAPERPAGLTPAMISGWLTGAIQTADPEHVAYILEQYRSWPASRP